MRKICYISGTRADFGLLRRTLQAIDSDPALALSVIVTGMHLDPLYGSTVGEIRDAGLVIRAEVPMPPEPATGGTMARNIGRTLIAFTMLFEADRPDLVLLLGDRGEMLAGALAAAHLNIPVAHIHGGERSGTIDETVRHAISKLAHLHFTATEASRERLIRMGEAPPHVHTVGAPGLDGLTATALTSRADVLAGHGLDPTGSFALMVYHPVLQEVGSAGEEVATLLAALRDAGLQTLVLMPNSDAGSAQVREAIEAVRGEAWIALATHLKRGAFISAMAAADMMVGNSSAGIIEAASFGTPVVNIGTRQNLRERNANTRDVIGSRAAIDRALAEAKAHGRYPPHNIYGDGGASARIVALVRDTPLTGDLLLKINSY